MKKKGFLKQEFEYWRDYVSKGNLSFPLESFDHISDSDLFREVNKHINGLNLEKKLKAVGILVNINNGISGISYIYDHEGCLYNQIFWEGNLKLKEQMFKFYPTQN